jgi:GT2 family glycosyltransferase
VSDKPSASDLTVVVVILNWNGKEDTLRCVESLVDGPDDQRLLIVDNGSYDGTLEEVGNRWPQVPTLQTGANLGFAGGMNAGLRWAIERGAKHIAVVNNDVVCPPETVSRLLRIAGPNTAVSPEVRYLSHPSKTWFGAGVIDWSQNWPRHLTPDELGHSTPSDDPIRTSEILAGCFILARADVWQQVGLFDERYFLIFEDSDWSVRARSAGIRLIVDSSTPIYHRVSASFGGNVAHLGTYYYMRNGLLFGRLWGVEPVAQLRFIVRRILPQLRPLVREHNGGGLFRNAVVLSWALGSFLFRRFGRAPTRLERVTSRWASN